MKKFIVLSAVFQLLSNMLLCQETTISYIRENGCEKLNPANIGSFREHTFIDYLINHILVDKKDTVFITNRLKLKEVKPSYYSNDSISFNMNSFILSVAKKSIELNKLGDIESDTFDINNEKSIAIYAINKKKIYGLTEPKDTVTILSNMSISKAGVNYYLPDSLISDVFFPNFHNIQYPIHPLKLYIDSKSEFSYLYIFGQNKLSLASAFDVRSFDTYMAKYIFYKGTFIKRIIVPWRVLFAYDWYCDKFIGF